jgi:hypothetical protein
MTGGLPPFPVARRSSVAPTLAIASLLLLACGASSRNGSGGEAGQGGTESSAAGAPADNGFPCEYPCSPIPDEEREPILPRPVCPMDDPLEGDACNTQGLDCSYGEAPNPACRRLYWCDSGLWHRDETIVCPEVPQDYCSEQPAPRESCDYSLAGVPCSYDEHVSCVCYSPNGLAAGAAWFCYGPSANKACPPTLPNIGEGCATNGTHCIYNVDGCYAPRNSTVYCFDGAWQEGDRLTCL